MSKVTTYHGESVVDVCIRSYGNLQGIITLCKDNDLAIDYEEATEATRIIDDVAKKNLVSSKPLFPVKQIAQRDEVVVFKDQNLVDLAMQETGSVEGIISLLRENNLGINSQPAYGTIIKTNTTEIKNADVKAFYRGLNYKVNTGSDLTTGPIPGEGGIGVMIIESTFIVG